MAKTIAINIQATNLGPHAALNSTLQTSSLEMGVYANNGVGKTFLSRAFRLVTKELLLSDDGNKLLTLGKNTGSFKLKITNTKETGVERQLELALERNVAPAISKNSTGYIFHVFNSDYVRENLEAFGFRPDGQIEGYILSKEIIDLTKEKQEFEQVKKDIEIESNILAKAIQAAKADVDDLSVRKNTGEYSLFEDNKLFNNEIIISENETFVELTKKHNILKSIPDSLPDLKYLQQINPVDIFEKAKLFIQTEFSKSSIAEEFKAKVKNKQSFIEEGVELINKEKNECPFCEQEFSKEALSLVDKYVEYLSDIEAKKIKEATGIIKQISDFKNSLSEAYSNSLKLSKEYYSNQKYIPSTLENSLVELDDVQVMGDAFTSIIALIEKKKDNISLSLDTKDFDNAVGVISEWLKNSNEAIETNISHVSIFNERKNNINAERLDLNRRLCRARFLELKMAQKDTIAKIIEKKKKETEIQNDIIIKEQSEKVAKKDKVVETFKLTLNKYFGDKYSFDENTFCLKLQNHQLETNASDVLSDGEKSIVAFCYYIAETHKVISKEEDYKKLFFVIDDPISSLDFHFVYATSQIIRTLNKCFQIDRLRVLLFTHNLEFMSILIRNKVIEQKFILNQGQIESVGNELIMPYEEHLRDVYAIAQGTQNACHTTPNSIRHILETINRFVAPDLDLAAFCNKISGFEENEFLYSLMHDGSHGGIRVQKAYTDGMIKRGCELIVDYISTDFKGQIELIKN